MIGFFQKHKGDSKKRFSHLPLVRLVEELKYDSWSTLQRWMRGDARPESRRVARHQEVLPEGQAARAVGPVQI